MSDETKIMPTERSLSASEKQKLLSITWLRCIAALLIVNMHITPLYPEQLSFLSFGGLFGNYLFVLISGFCFASIKKDFLTFINKRLVRIYVPYLLVAIPLFFSAQDYSASSILELVFPMKTYHFLASILLIYLVWYPLQWLMQKNKYLPYAFLAISLAMAVISFYFFIDYENYTLSSHFNAFELFMYLSLMLIGRIINKNRETFKNKWVLICGIATAVALFVLYAVFSKITNGQNSLLIWKCFISFGFVTSVCILFLSLEDRLCNLAPVAFVSSLTLEMYLVQFVIIDAFTDTGFPLGLFFGFFAIVGMAFVIKSISGAIISFPGWIKRRLVSPKRN